MKPLYRNVLLLAGAGIIIGLAVLLYTFRKTAVSVESEKAEFTVDAGVLLKAFETDESMANAVYLGKIISVTGRVESVSEDSAGISVYLKEDDDMAGILCSFDKSSDVTAIDQGKIVEIKGICTGYLMDVVMNRCALTSVKAGS